MDEGRGGKEERSGGVSISITTGLEGGKTEVG